MAFLVLPWPQTESPASLLSLDLAVQLLNFPEILKFSCLTLAAPLLHYTSPHTSLLQLKVFHNSGQAPTHLPMPSLTPSPLHGAMIASQPSKPYLFIPEPQNLPQSDHYLPQEGMSERLSDERAYEWCFWKEVKGLAYLWQVRSSGHPGIDHVPEPCIREPLSIRLVLAGPVSLRHGCGDGAWRSFSPC